jgi:hypothetical protein
MTAAAKPASTRSLDDILRDDYEYTTDLTSAGRYMPQLRRSARALVRYKDKLNAARQLVLQVLSTSSTVVRAHASDSNIFPDALVPTHCKAL